MNTNQLSTKKQNALLILILGSLEALTPFSIDMYLPAFTQIASDLQTTTAKVSFSISTYFIGFALGQIIYGPMLDYFGRKKPLYVGLLIYILSTIGIMYTNSIEVFLVISYLKSCNTLKAMVITTTCVYVVLRINLIASIRSIRR